MLLSIFSYAYLSFVYPFCEMSNHVIFWHDMTIILIVFEMFEYFPFSSVKLPNQMAVGSFWKKLGDLWPFILVMAVQHPSWGPYFSFNQWVLGAKMSKRSYFWLSFRFYSLCSTLIHFPFNLLLGKLCSINHFHNSLFVRHL